MKTISLNRVNMIRISIIFLTEKASAFADIQKFPEIKLRIENKIILIDALNGIAISSSKGPTIDTNQIREVMIVNAFVCANPLAAFATETPKNITLFNKVNFTLPKLRKLNKDEIDDRCDIIHTEADANLAVAGPFGYEAADVTDLRLSIDLYRIKVQSPRMFIISRSQAISKIDTLVREIIDDLFKDKITRMVNSLFKSNHDLTAEWKRANEIIDLGSRSTRSSGSIRNAQGTFLIGAKFYITNPGETQIVAQTFAIAEGKYSTSNITPGIYDFHWEFAGYQNITETNVQIQAGKNIRRKITMQTSNGLPAPRLFVIIPLTVPANGRIIVPSDNIPANAILIAAILKSMNIITADTRTAFAFVANDGDSIDDRIQTTLLSGQTLPEKTMTAMGRVPLLFDTLVAENDGSVEAVIRIQLFYELPI